MSVPSPPTLGLQTLTTTLGFLTWVLGNKLKSSCVLGNTLLNYFTSSKLPISEERESLHASYTYEYKVQLCYNTGTGLPHANEPLGLLECSVAWIQIFYVTVEYMGHRYHMIVTALPTSPPSKTFLLFLTLTIQHS